MFIYNNVYHISLLNDLTHCDLLNFATAMFSSSSSSSLKICIVRTVIDLNNVLNAKKRCTDWILVLITIKFNPKCYCCFVMMIHSTYYNILSLSRQSLCSSNAFAALTLLVSFLLTILLAFCLRPLSLAAVRLTISSSWRRVIVLPFLSVRRSIVSYQYLKLINL